MQPDEVAPKQPSPGAPIGSSNWRRIAIIIVILPLLAGIGGYLLRINQSASRSTQKAPLPPSPTITAQSTPTAPFDSTANWKTYKDAKQGYSFIYPPEIQLQENIDGSLLLYLEGPMQESDTEFYDGIYVRFHTGKLGGQTLKQLVEQKITQSQELEDILLPITSITFAGFTGYTYRASGLGENSYLYLESKPGAYIEITNSTSDPSQEGFQRIVDHILSTFEVLQSD